MRTDTGWPVDFTQEQGKDGWKRGCASPCWGPDTLVAHGVWGKKLAALVNERKGKLDRLSTLAVRRDMVERATFAAVHEPFAPGQSPAVRQVELLDSTDEALLVQVQGKDFTDLAALALGNPNAKHCLGKGQTVVCFQDYAFVRVDQESRAEITGRCTGLRLPGAAVVVRNGVEVGTTIKAGTLIFGNPGVLTRGERQQQEQALALEVRTEPEVVRGFARQRVPIRFVVRNTSTLTLQGYIAADLHMRRGA